MRQWLYNARRENHMTMAQTAEKLNISESAYSQIENGNRQKNIRLGLAVQLADLFHLDIRDIANAEIRNIGNPS